MQRYKYEEYNELLRQADQAMRNIRLKCGDDGYPDGRHHEFLFYVTVKSVHNLFHKIQEALDDALANHSENHA